MESPINMGGTLSNSIQHRLQDAHLENSWVSSIYSGIYSGEKIIQLNLRLQGSGASDGEVTVMRRVSDSYVNVSQMLDILVRLEIFNEKQVSNFVKNEILSDPSFSNGVGEPLYDDLRESSNIQLRGVWIPYDRAVSLALRFDVYEFTKKLFLVDQNFDLLPVANKRGLPEDIEKDTAASSLMGSPIKKQKQQKDVTKADATESEDEVKLVEKIAKENINAPYLLPPLTDVSDEKIAADLKSKFGEVFKKNEEDQLPFEQIKALFEPLLSKNQIITDLALDGQGQTALHFASTLASLNLISAFIKLGLNSPLRANLQGDSPLVSSIMVTNSMEKGNFQEILNRWLWPGVWLSNENNVSVFHVLSSQSGKKSSSSKFYLTKILEYIFSNEKHLYNFKNKLLDSRENINGNTCLHYAAENESKWFIKVLLELRADVNIANKAGVKAIDFDIVNEVMQNKSEFEDEHIFSLIKTNVDFLAKRLETNGNIDSFDDTESTRPDKDVAFSSSNKIFKSIQDLLLNTNSEYEEIISSKKAQMKSLNKSLHDATIVTANNRFMTRKIADKINHSDNLKLQLSNISEKLKLTQRELTESGYTNDEFKEEEIIIQPLYERLSKDETTDDLKEDQSFIQSLPSTAVLKARIKAYETLNENIENELKNLFDYTQLTSKFKKVVSICTGVDINEVDELLDGLLEAVEGQQ